MARISLSGKELPVGIDVGENHIRAVQLKHRGDKLVLNEFAYIETPPGAVRNGEILNPGEVAGALKELFAKARFTGSVVATGVSNQQTIFRLVNFPWTESKDLNNAVMMQAQDYIPIPVEDAMIDYAVTGEKYDEDGERVYEIMLSAIQRSVIDNVVASFEQAGLKLVRIDLTALAIARALLGDLQRMAAEENDFLSSERIAVLHVASGVVNLTIIDQGVPRFVRFLPQGGMHLTNALAQEMDIDFDKAEALKIAVGLPSEDGSIPEIEGYTPDVIIRAQSVIEREIASLIGEIRLSFDFYISQSDDHTPITRIYATGSAVQLQNMGQFLSTSLDASVEIIDPFGSIEIPATLEKYMESQLYSYAPAIGLAIGGR